MGRQIVVVDKAHCGTSMLAGILEILGVPMLGDTKDLPLHREDNALIAALKEGPDAFAAAVALREARRDVWGFKWPGAWQYADTLNATLSDPVYLAIFKDIVSVTRRRFGQSKRDRMGKLRNTSRQMDGSIKGIRRSGLDVVFYSYLDAVLDPIRFVRAVVKDTGLDVTGVQVECASEFIQPLAGGRPRGVYPG